MMIAAFEVMEMNEYYVATTGEYTPALSTNFQLIGFDSKWYINNLGTLGILMVSMLLIYLARPVLLPCKKNLHA